MEKSTLAARTRLHPAHRKVRAGRRSQSRDTSLPGHEASRSTSRIESTGSAETRPKQRRDLWEAIMKSVEAKGADSIRIEK
eukprot:574110-Pyramimonas_sp.AAC.1